MDGFRYPQFCALARAAEIVGERWTLPLLRELFIGPQRFSDLRRRLPGLSSSVLSTRLARLEGLGVIRRRTLPPPAASAVYELDAAGQALRPALEELVRWGVRFLRPPRPGDHVEPEWVRFGLETFARSGPSPARRFAVEVEADPAPLRLYLIGGPEGTRVEDEPCESDLAFRAGPVEMLGLCAGLIDGPSWLGAGGRSFRGDPEAIRDLPHLFDLGSAMSAHADPAAGDGADREPTQGG